MRAERILSSALPAGSLGFDSQHCVFPPGTEEVAKSRLIKHKEKTKFKSGNKLFLYALSHKHTTFECFLDLMGL